MLWCWFLYYSFGFRGKAFFYGVKLGSCLFESRRLERYLGWELSGNFIVYLVIKVIVICWFFGVEGFVLLFFRVFGELVLEKEFREDNGLLG